MKTCTFLFKTINMRKIIQFSFFCMTLALSMKASAQLPGPKLPKVLAFANFTYASPSNSDFKNISNNGVGFEAGAGIGMGKTLIIASLGQISYNIPNTFIATSTTGIAFTSSSSHLKVTPLKVGIRRYLIGGLFLNGNLGVAMQKYDNSTVTGSTFLYEGGAGWKIGFLELGAAYTGFNLAGTSQPVTANALLLKAGLAIKL